MDDRDRRIVVGVLQTALGGTGAHVDTGAIFSGLDWKLAGIRPEHAPHTVFQLLNHIIFWQDWVVAWLDDRAPSLPKHAAASWPGPGAAASRKEWDQAVRRFHRGLEVLTRRAHRCGLSPRAGAKSQLQMLHTIASHNSYHAGQVVLVRQLLGAWPPPSGGLTW